MSGPARAGFVLAGGRSSRMGRDKALLPLGDETMLDRVTRIVRDAAGSVTLIAPPDRYATLGVRVIPDKIENCGPLSGLFTALSITDADWNLVVACDMPNLTVELLEELFRTAETSNANAVVPYVTHQTAAGLDPLCAVYHRRCVAFAASAIGHKIFKMHDFLSTLQLIRLPVRDSRALQNINTPEEFAAR
jgi:molybdenum cofactor guanylyltransferase